MIFNRWGPPPVAVGHWVVAPALHAFVEKFAGGEVAFTSISCVEQLADLVSGLSWWYPAAIGPFS